MFSKFKAAWARLAGGGQGADSEGRPDVPPVEYNGYLIQPAPYRYEGQYQTAGVIRKHVGDEVKEHRFIRAESHQAWDDAVAFSITKGKQIIDQQGDAIFAMRTREAAP